MNTIVKRHAPIIALFFILSSIPNSTVCAKKPLDWTSVKKTITKNFPDVVHISTQQLYDLIATPDTVMPILLDSKEPEEYAVSHLRHALPAASKKKALVILKDIHKDTLIVIYCSEGYRSGSLAEQLMGFGYTNVYNLEGSIFKWANEGRPLFKDDKQVKRAHTYDKTWGTLLKKKLWSFTPEK